MTPFEHHVFVPFITHESPSLTALVLIDLASVPALGSVIAKAPIISPAIDGTRYFSFCSSVPNLATGRDPRSTWAATPFAIPAQVLPSSSANIH